MAIRGDRLRWPPRPGKRWGAASSARRLASTNELPSNIGQQPPKSTNGSTQSDSSAKFSSHESTHPACDVETAHQVDDKLTRDD